VPEWVIHPLEFLCTKRNTHSRYLDRAGDRRIAFSIVLVGNQIEYLRLVLGPPTDRICAQMCQFWRCLPMTRVIKWAVLSLFREQNYHALSMRDAVRWADLGMYRA